MAGETTREALERLVEASVVISRINGVAYCQLCPGVSDVSKAAVEHDADCPVALGRAALAHEEREPVGYIAHAHKTNPDGDRYSECAFFDELHEAIARRENLSHKGWTTVDIYRVVGPALDTNEEEGA